MMGRLTKRVGGTVVYAGGCKQYEGGDIPAEVSPQGVRELLVRLAEYEDTGMAPEDVLTALELKPCPFCGGTAKIRHDSDGPGYSYVECEKCHMKSTRFMRLFERSSDEDAKAFWNRRVTE